MLSTPVDSSQEKRIFERFSARFPVKFKDSREDFGADVFLRDASAGGVRLVTKERFFIDDQLALEVALPDGKDPMIITGHVVWAKLVNLSFWDIGIEFPEVNFIKMQRLFKLTEEPAS